jgi:hypothetical protein
MCECRRGRSVGEMILGSYAFLTAPVWATEIVLRASVWATVIVLSALVLATEIV